MLTIEFSEFPFLETKRLWLRKMQVSDIPVFYALRSNSTFEKYLDRDKPKSVEEIEQLVSNILKQFDNNEAICWVISLKEDPRLVGTISFWRIDKKNHRAEIGYGLHPEFHKKGLMQEAMEVVLKYGFEEMELHSIEANINPLNLASQKLLEKNKFVKEAHFKQNYFFNGTFVDSVIYSLLKSSFDQKHI